MSSDWQCGVTMGRGGAGGRLFIVGSAGAIIAIVGASGAIATAAALLIVSDASLRSGAVTEALRLGEVALIALWGALAIVAVGAIAMVRSTSRIVRLMRRGDATRLGPPLDATVRELRGASDDAAAARVARIRAQRHLTGALITHEPEPMAILDGAGRVVAANAGARTCGCAEGAVPATVPPMATVVADILAGDVESTVELAGVTLWAIAVRVDSDGEPGEPLAGGSTLDYVVLSARRPTRGGEKRSRGFSFLRRRAT